MNKFVFLSLGIIFLLGCTQQLPAAAPSSAVPVPGMEDVQETVVIEEEPESLKPTAEPEELPEPQEVIKEFTITARQWDFEPSTITVDKGDKVRIEITSTDVTPGFLLPAFDINEKLEYNQAVIVEFVADKTGEFPFRCNVPCGSGHGSMTGTLIVK